MWWRNFLIFIAFCTAQAAWAQPAPTPEPLPPVMASHDLEEFSRDLDGLESDNQLKIAKLDALRTENRAALPADQPISQEHLSETRSSLESIQNHINALNLALADNGKELAQAQRTAEQLLAAQQKRANPLSANRDDDAVAHFRTLLERNARHIALLQRQKTALQEALKLGRQHHALMDARYQRYNERYLEARENAGKTLPDTYLQDQKRLQNQREQLARQLTQGAPERDSRLTTNIDIALIDKQILYHQLARDIESLDLRLQDLQFADFSSVSLDRIERIQEELLHMETRLDNSKTLLEDNFRTITEQFALYARQISDMPAHITRRHSQMNEQYHHLHRLLENNLLNLALIRKNADSQYTALSKHYLSERFRFGGSLNRLPALALSVAKAPVAFLGQYSVAASTFADTLKQQSKSRLTLLAALALILIIATGYLTSHMNHLARRMSDGKRLSFARRILLFVTGMLKYLLPYLGLFALVWGTLSYLDIPAPSYGLLLLPAAALLFVAIPYFAVRILIGSHLMEGAEDQRLIRPVTTIALIGTLLASLVVLATGVLTDQNTIDAYRFIFCLYMLLVSLPVYRLTRRTTAYLSSHYSDSRIYRILRLLAYLICAGIFLFGLTGTLGYLNLAWSIALHQLHIWAFILIWTGILALAKDASLWAKRHALKNTNNGVFWAQDVINPLHALIHWGSLVGLTYLLFRLFHWNAHSPGIQPILAILNTPIFGGEDSQFTLMNLLLMGLLIYIVFRIGRWSRSLAYRWIFAKIGDLGIRNSLSVFSQYTIVTLGFLLALRIIGLDLTTFTVFAGALGVGIGFGLQTIANNFISGLLLLIERPLRNGDTISVGNYDGKVERIGMRSLTITTFNNESVILPNSDFVTSAFKNWSHSDQILRMVFYIDLSYRHNPDHVVENLMHTMRELVAEGLIMDELPDFIPGVFAFNYSERGMTYRIQYYFNLEQNQMFPTKHRVVQRIWQTCHDHGYEIAYPKQDIYFPPAPEQAAQRYRDLPFHPEAKT
ncbi:MAG: mechanosensitive ion channel [Cardiobacteriaceae bacterium]|nr:mechanosensitive ion channel [Cardiobacteriaceae bacterium]